MISPIPYSLLPTPSNLVADKITPNPPLRPGLELDPVPGVAVVTLGAIGNLDAIARIGQILHLGRSAGAGADIDGGIRVLGGDEGSAGG